MSILAKIKRPSLLSLSQAAFSLIEFMVALAIGLIMLGLLYSSITRTYKSVSSIEQTIDGHSAIALYLERFEKDISGAFIPTQARINLRKNKQEQKQEEKFNKKEEPKKSELLSVFLLKGMRNGSAGELSFVTTSALSVYNRPASYLVRVVYKLEKARSTTSSQENLLSLVRYESSELNYDRLRSKLGKDVRGYEILSNIEAFTINCSARVENNAAKDSSPSFENFSEWNSDNRKQEGLLLLPGFVHCTGTLREGKKAISFEYTTPIYAYNSQLATETKKLEHQSENIAKENEKKTDKQSEKKDENSSNAKESSLLASLLKSSMTS